MGLTRSLARELARDGIRANCASIALVQTDNLAAHAGGAGRHGLMADDFQPAAPFGAPVRRREDPRLLTGRGRYVSDVELPRMLHVAFVRSTHAHARLRDVDTRTADQIGRAHV